ncbi:hypothetical protein HHI36_002780 [Cryptolaemus montrouzieri]|uniref:Cyclic nucleotide-binding domain-containing protein n=1 Tax=Cryptolaemus montrouzieri TaxID=559131 RepID=A0ABD2PC02_9CUCU
MVIITNFKYIIHLTYKQLEIMRKYGYFDHRCDLPAPSESCLVDIPPYLPKTVKWFRSLRRYIVVDENSRRTKNFFRSYAAVMKEKRRHAQGYFMTIHPFSIFAIYRERILCLMWFLCYITDPVSWSFATVAVNHPLLLFQTCLDVLFLINTLTTSFIGYTHPMTKEIELCPKTIFKYRVWTYLIPEFISCVPVLMIMNHILQVDAKTNRLPAISAIRILRCLRVCDFFKYLNNIFHELRMREWVYTWFVMVIINIYAVFWLTCALFYLEELYYTYDGLPENSFLRNRAPKGSQGTYVLEPEDNFHNSFLTLFTTASCHFYGANEGYIPVELNVEKVLCAFILLCGYICCNFVTARLLQVCGSSNISETKYEELIYQDSEYARSKNLPDKLRKHLLTFHEYKFHRRFFHETVILATLSEHLRNEVILYDCRNVLEKVPLFQGMAKGVVGSILPYMKKEIFLPNDVVLKYGEPLVKMFWVSYGTLAVHYGPDVVEILHFEDGDHFGDVSITKQGGPALLTVIALEITEIFTLSRKDVKHCTAFIKEMSERILKINSEKKRLYPALAKMMTNEGTRNTVLAELRKGRILERDRWRRK